MKKLIIPILLVSILFLCSCTQEKTSTSLIGTETRLGDYTCTKQECKVKCSINCNTQNPQSVVISRTTSLDYSSGKIAVDINNDGNLESYDFVNKYTNWRCSASMSAFTFYDIVMPNGYTLGKYNAVGCIKTGLPLNSIIVINDRGNWYYDVSVYKISTITLINFTSTQAQAEYDGKEKYTSMPYNCKTEFVINGMMGEVLAYSGTSPSAKESAFYTLSGTQQATCRGTPTGTITAELYGDCGFCNPSTYSPTCIDSITLQKCVYDTSGCGKYTTERVDDMICQGNKLETCNDNNDCTTDKRLGTDLTCTFTKFTCSDTQQQCQSGKCVCPNEASYCLEQDAGLKKCVNNDVWSCQQEGLCYKWKESEPCGAGEVCI